MSQNRFRSAHFSGTTPYPFGSFSLIHRLIRLSTNTLPCAVSSQLTTMKAEVLSNSPTGGSGDLNYDVETAIPRGSSAWFGGPNVRIGPRIAPLVAPIVTSESDSDLGSDTILSKQIEAEANCAIQYRTCSWQKTAALLFSEYICLVSRQFAAPNCVAMCVR